MSKNTDGMTLVEMVVAMAILAIFAIALIPVIGSIIEKSNVSRLLADVEGFKAAAQSFQADVGNFATFVRLDDVPANSDLVDNVSNLTRWQGPYLDSNQNIHPWGGVYHLDFTDIDRVTPQPNNPRREDFIVKLKNFDLDNNPIIMDEPDIENKINNKTTGEIDPVNPKAAVVAGELQVVVLSNVR